MDTKLGHMGEVARKVYGSSVLRQRIVSLCPPLYQSVMAMVLFNDLVLLRLISCDYQLLPSKIGKFWIRAVQNVYCRPQMSSVKNS